MTPSLFDPSPTFDRSGLAGRLSQLARDRVYIGTSSWKYQGWLGQIYTSSSYLWRGQFAKRVFEQECLREYADVFPTVCGDFSFYQFPAPEYWQRLFARVPSGFRFAFKVPEQITCKIFPNHPRYGVQGGLENPSFLDSELLKEQFLRPLEGHRDQVCVLIFEFGAFSARSFETVERFSAELDPFLAALPGQFRYAVEIRNPDFLRPAYFACLRSHGVAHVFNAWSRMPELARQIHIPDAVTADFVVSRALLRFGRMYEQAVERFTPYSEIQDPNLETRTALRELIEKTRQARREAYIYVNNRLEGNAPGTIAAIVGMEA